jgi:hypothetical protein
MQQVKLPAGQHDLKMLRTLDNLDRCREQAQDD